MRNGDGRQAPRRTADLVPAGSPKDGNRDAISIDVYAQIHVLVSVLGKLIASQFRLPGQTNCVPVSVPKACTSFPAKELSILYQHPAGEGEAAVTRKKKAASKTKYTCPACDLNACAKPDVKLICGNCKKAIRPEEQEDESRDEDSRGVAKSVGLWYVDRSQSPQKPGPLLLSAIRKEKLVRRWTVREFDTVHSHPELSAQELTEPLPERSVDAIECCRVGIDRFLNGRPVAGFLSQAPVRRMEELHPDIGTRR